MEKYLVACVHAGKEEPIAHYVEAESKESAMLAFMAWHEKRYPHRRAYNVVVYRAL